MQKETFKIIFTKSIAKLSTVWKSQYADLLVDEHWQLLGDRVFVFVFQHKMAHPEFPVFEEEIIADYSQHYQYFAPLRTLPIVAEESVIFLAHLLESVPIASLLVILGQRKTPATLCDACGIPPTTEALLQACFKPYNQQIGKAARAREKHLSRNGADHFWGSLIGTPVEKEQATRSIVERILAEKTWWNVFTHYKHGIVYEARVASGQGIRWKLDELEFIGFLEPFI